VVAKLVVSQTIRTHAHTRGCKLAAGLGGYNFSAVAWSKLAMMSFCVYALCSSLRNPTHTHTHTHTHKWGTNIWGSRSRATTHTHTHTHSISSRVPRHRNLNVSFKYCLTSRVNFCTFKCNTRNLKSLHSSNIWFSGVTVQTEQNKRKKLKCQTKNSSFCLIQITLSLII